MILIADDCADTAEVLSLYLHNEGHSVVTATDGCEAIALAKKYKLSCALLDLTLPSVDGFDVASTIGTFSDAVLIAQTGRYDDDGIRAAVEAGFDYYIAKPFEFSLLDQAIQMPKQPDKLVLLGQALQARCRDLTAKGIELSKRSELVRMRAIEAVERAMRAIDRNTAP